MFEQIVKAVKENQLLITGLGVVGFSTVVGIAYKLYGYISRALSYFCFVRMSFESVDYLNFKKVQYWLYNLPYTKKRCRNFNIRYVRKNGKAGYKSEEDEDQLFYPGFGTHYLMCNRRPTIIHYNKSDSKELAFRETIDISIFCLFKKVKATELILEQINKIYDEVEYTTTSIHACIDSYGGWEELVSKSIKQRPILDTPSGYDEFLDDVQQFIANEDWYTQRGISYKRGYLLEGKPGNGKSSIILKIAQDLKKHINIINLTSTIIDDAKFIELVTSLNRDAILAIEDIDGIYADRSKDMDGEKNINTVTFSTILNVLDGLFSPEGLIFFITTNHPKKLDPALIRPGRIAYTKTFNDSNEYQCGAIFERFFPEATQEQITRFKSKGIGRSMSYLENHLIKHAKDIVKAANID